MIKIFQITTYSGKYIGVLPFLSDEELKEFNAVGHSGRTINGLKSTIKDYLNSLNKGEFEITQTKFDDGSFQESFIITWNNT